MRKRLFILSGLCLALALIGCQRRPPSHRVPASAVQEEDQSQGPDETGAATATSEPVAPRPTQTQLPTPATHTPSPTEAPVETTATPVPIEPTATAEPWYGEFEGTFYRGSPGAPVRLIDYSDFL